jgi:hypothetical protein
VLPQPGQVVELEVHDLDVVALDELLNVLWAQVDVSPFTFSDRRVAPTPMPGTPIQAS